MTWLPLVPCSGAAPGTGTLDATERCACLNTIWASAQSVPPTNSPRTSLPRSERIGGGLMIWSGPGPDGKPMTYVQGKVLESDPPKLLKYDFSMGPSGKPSRVTVELLPETEATKVTVKHDEWADDDPAYAQCADGWPRILSRLKTLIETGKTFKPH